MLDSGSPTEAKAFQHLHDESLHRSTKTLQTPKTVLNSPLMTRSAGRAFRNSGVTRPLQGAEGRKQIDSFRMFG